MSAAHPAYLRVLEDLRARIRSGALPPGGRAPSRNQIIARYRVGETAAKHALHALATEGLIDPRPGSGSFVRARAAARCLEHDRLLFPGSPFGLDPDPGAAGDEDARGAAGPRLSWEHQTQRAPPPARVACRLGLGQAELAVRTVYLQRADAAPVQLITSHEPARLTEGTPVALPEQGRFAGRGVIERMRAIGVHVDHVVEEVAVRRALDAESAALEIPAGTAVLVVEREHRAGDRVVEAGEIVAAADRVRLRYRFPVGGAEAP